MNFDRIIGKYLISNVILGEGTEGICKKACLKADMS